MYFITNDELKDVYNTEDIDQKRLKVLEICRKCEYNTKYLQNIIEIIKTTSIPQQIDKSITDLYFVQNNMKVIK